MPKSKFFNLTAMLLLVALSSAACDNGIQSALNPAGPQANRLNDLWWLMFYVSSIVFVLVIIAMFVAVKKRSTDDAGATAPVLQTSAEQERRMRNVVLTAVIVTAAILFVFLIVSFSTGRAVTADMAKKNGVTIEITGHQWWWEVRYWDVDASNIFVTANEIHIPV